MNTILKSDNFTAVAKSIEIKIATKQLRDLPAVSAGETNHDINAKCCNIYNNIASMLDSYCNAGERDGERVRKIADGLDMADREMGNDIASPYLNVRGCISE